jgi:negative regulator of flagellin synthesis FlgM
MTERINGQGFRPADTAGARRPDAAKPAGGGAAESSSQSSSSAPDTVNLTSSALLMSRLEQVVQNLPVADAERVRAIKDAIASGTYEIDDQSVADNLLRFERELLA